jgi:glyoxylase-like metal-dependent hydrolase (beta-lactamase superfamily II)
MMAYQYRNKVNNVYMLDTNMFGFPLFQSSYLVSGSGLALIDTGAPLSLEVLRAGIKAHGFSVKDITHIFVTHSEHPDHSGNVGALFQENTTAKVYINPIGAEYMIDPSIDEAKRKANLSPQMAARFGSMIPVQPSRIYNLKDGESFDLGEGEKLKVIFTPGHQPSGLVITEDKNKGLFINDLPGSYFADAEAAWIFTPFRSDVTQAMTSLRKVSKMNLDWLYLGHFGMCDKPAELIKAALARIQQLLDIAAECIKAGNPQDIETRSLALRLPEAEKIRKTRGDEGLYFYLSHELIPSLSKAFMAYSLQNR